MQYKTRTFLCMISLAFSVNYPQQVWASDAFTNKDFLAMPDVQKKFWLSGAISTLSSVAFVKEPAQGKCVYDWYFKDTANKNGKILSAMTQYPDAIPAAVIIAMLERDCGRFVRAN